MKLSSRIAGFFAPPQKSGVLSIPGEIAYDSVTGRLFYRDGVAATERVLGVPASTTVPSCRYGRSAVASFAANSTWQAMNFDTKLWDTDGIQDSVNTTRFYARTAGVYDLKAAFSWSNQTSDKEACFRANGSTFYAVETQQSGGTWGDYTLGTTVRLAAGEYIELCFFIATGSTAANINSSASYSPQIAMTWLGGAGNAVGALGGVGSASVPFTDGDTVRRVSVADSSVTATSKISGTIRRPNVTADLDRGYIYNANVVNVYAGGFDLLVAATGWGFDDPSLVPPNETVQFVYVIG